MDTHREYDFLVKHMPLGPLDLGCPRKELIEQYLYGENREAPVFRLDGREHLKVVDVHCTDPGDYRALLEQGTGREEVA